MSGEQTVLVTGGSGFIASHAILQLFAAGYRVRTTVRRLSREADVRAMLKTGGAEPGDRLSFAEADLERDAGWAEAVVGCDYVLHVASPFPPGVPKHEDELIVPAREGALRVLRAACDAGVKRVVLTSSFAAVGCVVDVRDVAALHLTAMTHPSAKGERFLAVSADFMSILGIAKVLKARMGNAAKRAPTRELPNWVVRLAALRDPGLRMIVSEVGKNRNATSAKATRLLGWTPRTREDALVATGESLVRLGVVTS